MLASATFAAPVVGWDAPDHAWLRARRKGIGASEISAVLGFPAYRTPWQVWADKQGVPLPPEPMSEAASLGHELEPWLLEQATRLVGTTCTTTPHRLYAHPQHPWRIASPDGMFLDGRLCECKTAGIAGGFGTPTGWTDKTMPLGYDLQGRWQMHVMDAPAVEVIALVAGLGLRRYTIVRDLTVEADMVAQVERWRQRHLIDGEEPPLGRGDNDILDALYPKPTAGQINLDRTDAAELWMRYRDAHQQEKTAKTAKETTAAALKGLLGVHEAGLVDGHTICTWSPKQGPVDWQRMAQDLAQQASVAMPDPDTYRKPDTRTLSVKDL